MTQVSASLFGANFSQMADEVEHAQAAGVDSFHVDFMDGHYVPNIALAPYHLAALAPKTNLPFQVHLEIANPDELLDTFEPFPAEMIIVQWDTCQDLPASIERIRSWKARVGLGLLPLASIDPILPYLDQLDMLLLLSVEPGFGGQGMIDGTLLWLESMAQERDALAPHLPIGIDGGVKDSNAADLVHAGADVLIMGTGLFDVTNMKSLVQELKSLER